MFHVLPIVALPLYERLVTLSAIDCVLGLPPARKLRAPRRRCAVAAMRITALRPSEGKGKGTVSFVQNLHMYILHDFSNERSKGAAGSPAATAPGEFQHRFGRRPRRRVGICRVAMASSAWRKLCSSNFVETVVGVSDASSRRATAVATHSKSVAMSLMVRPGAGRLRWPAREELRPRPERKGCGAVLWRGNNVCRLRRARRKPAVIIPSIPLFASEARGRAPKAVALQRGTIERTVEESAYVPRRRRGAFAGSELSSEQTGRR